MLSVRACRWYKKAIENNLMHAPSLSNYARLLATHYNDRCRLSVCG
jgi:hypothetical protein